MKHHRFQSRAKLADYTPIVSIRQFLILSSRISLGFLSGLFPSIFPTKTVYAFLIFPILATCLTLFMLHDLIIIATSCLVEYKIMMSFTLHFSLVFCYLVSLRLKHSPQPHQSVLTLMGGIKFNTHKNK